MDNLVLCEANNVPLTPITFLKRASECYPNRTSIIYGQTRFTWPQTYDRCCRLAASLLSLNITRNDVVSILAPNVPAMYEMHFSVPMTGAVLNPINTRLDAKTIAIILRHAEPKILFVDYEFAPLIQEVLRLIPTYQSQPHPRIILINEIDSTTKPFSKELDYEGLIRKGEPTPSSSASMFRVHNEHDPISLNYTSGTTADPKGVVISHQGAYLSALSSIIGWEMGIFPVYLWTLPMFHCNGWTHTWSVAARGGTNVCIRHVTAPEIYKNIELHGVTHMSCVPTVFRFLLEGSRTDQSPKSSPVQVLTGGSSPPAVLIKKVEQLGFHVMHGYGLTEATGPVLFCEWQDEWNKLPEHQQIELQQRQGVRNLTLADVDVKNTKTLESVPRDGKTMGEIVIKGSSLMKGYLKNPKATSEAFKHGWLNTGDIGVIHPDGYVEIKDRSKDIIISGGENISSIEVEKVLYMYQEVLEAAVVAMPHPLWGETPCAFVVLKKGEEGLVTSEGDLIKYCRENMPHFMCPKKVVFFQELPKNSNGKILKSKLRDIAKALVVREDDAGSKKVHQRSIEHVSSRL
ncbi:AMP-binding enzyme, putative [Arabidopsis thaliana]|uniref:Butyrate--CoA ligase AAE11, peroxisomal n=1 Tax=Arabidopsis thaliana TaxID=3702 RepID=AAE11_ARATH|nr:AMP-dependent synthetase and ligase family protein [Arabidopsis thaliana]Q9C8D4.1 RecName: Full=Butyrate--CoA ligase AAE11, peroxisomal; AltName: Full=Acyl-activating enzyme 11; AltName: Full=Butyryl-CoA synthetase [Arabidopsis thaliana]AAG51304.1 AMP-binding enzyme, putative [Arabidopsis thaliana]AAO42311.1 putative AMP-binding enzyme [Arabidopsis thaliana]ABO38762.1 At1g66120 [Arabidopsis thaliana]AEE34464.1 AMP-dependent synthetase and ligase family protein [Arabidopsis thaliana]|eukprot:NP_176786.1 AMP-dependent synthetase and ligase family protein [Arabidopsis thaliana]